MSTENIRAFFNQAQTDENLQKALAELPSLPSSEGIDVLVKLSQTTAFPFTAEELAAGVRSPALSDTDLAEVAGGKLPLDGMTDRWRKIVRDLFGLAN
jgi:predicted ribosomally synthesized peptide with nif11-like leader